MSLVPTPTAVAVWVLSGGGGAPVRLDLLVSCVEALVALPLIAGLVVIQRLMIAPGHFSCRLLGGVLIVTTCGVLVRAIPEIGIVGVGHVLQDDLAVKVGMTHAAAVLHVPVDVEFGALVILHGPFGGTLLRHVIVVVLVLARWLAIVADLIARGCIVLRVEQAIGVLHVVALLTQLVVGASGAVEVHVSLHKLAEAQQDGERAKCHGAGWRGERATTQVVEAELE